MTTVVPFRTPKINLAPDVMVPVADPHLFNPSDRQVSYNAPADQMFAPLYGPHDPSKPHTYCNTIAGHFEISNMNDFVFHQEHLKHLKDGCPESAEADRRRKRTAEQLLKTAGAKKSRKDDESDDEDRDDRGELAGLLPAPPSAADDIPEEYREFLGGFKEDQSHVDPSRQALVARVGGNALELPGDEEKEGLTVYFEEDERRGKRVARYEAIEPKSIMHIQRLYDYQGRSFMYNPLKESDKPAFLPKSLLHTWRGHNKPISAIRWFPPHGHLIMSCSMDNKIKLWDVMNQRNVIQTYLGHSKAVRDICFDNTGDRFISCGYDRFLRVWDTETGKAISTFTTGKQPFVVKFNPDPARQSIFLAGMGDKKIVQWDLRTSRIVQEYNQHMGAVNSITFIDNNRRFVTTADDKSIRIWEFDIPITIKYLADPNMHSMPTVTAHPSGKYLAFQSMGNEILIYQCQDRFRLQNRKKFRGHVNSGYACQVAFSNDGKFICSGDGDGNVWFWEWKSTRMVKKFRAHDKACTGLLWHPVEQSRVATSGWDNMIKFWD